jgi:hypothetical protein
MATNSSLNNQITAADFTITAGNLLLPATTTTAGAIIINTKSFIHAYGARNTSLGLEAGLIANMSAVNDCTNIGYRAGYTCQSNAPGNVNIGSYAGYSNTTGGWNTCVGLEANYTNSDQSGNTAIGYQALKFIDHGVYNTALGFQAGMSITTGYTSNIMINADGAAADNNCLRIGNGLGTGDRQLNKVYIHGIYTTAATPSGTAKITLTDSNALQYGLAGAANTIFIGGTAPSFSATPQCTDLTLTGVLKLPTTSATVGQIQINSQIWAHAYASEYSVYLGRGAGNQTLSGTYNVGIGGSSLNKITSGGSNVGIGNGALFSCTTSGNNVGIGNNALVNLTTAANGVNVAIGYNAMNGVTTGGYNLALGFSAGSSCVTGSENSNIYLISTGANAESNAIRIGITGSSGGQQNKAFIAGTYATGATPSGTAKVALIDSAELHYGLTNTASALLHVAAAGTAPIWSTGPTVTGTMSAASFATTTAATTMTLNAKTITMGGSDTDVSLIVVPKGAGTVTCAAIYSNVVTGNAVLVDSSGNLGVATSSRRFKENIKDMDVASGKLLELRPVTFNYKKDSSETIQYGLIAEEVEKVYPELVSFDSDGKPMSVQYHVLPAMLLNEIQKLSKRIEFLEAMLDARDLR